MNNDLFAAALGLSEPWFVAGLQFSEGERLLTVRVDFRKGSRFPHGEGGAMHPVHDTRTRRCRHLNFFQHECVLEVRTPRVRLPGGQVATVGPPWAGRLPGFTLLFEALVVALCREMPFAAAARLAGLSWHKAAAVKGFARRGGKPDAVASVSIDMSAAFIKGARENLPNARITFDKFHVVARASEVVDRTRRTDLDALVAKAPGRRTARA